MADQEKPQDNVQTNVPEASPEWQERRKWQVQKEQEIRLQVRLEMEELLKIWKQNELTEIRKEYEKLLQEGTKKAFDEWKAEQTPPTSEDIQKLLSQEYETFNLPVVFADDAGETKNVAFVIRELPQSAEKKFYRQFKSKVLDKVSMLAAFDQENMNAKFEDKLKAIIEMIDDGFDVLAEAVAIILNPFGKTSYINTKWVQDNISSDRQWRILEAQIHVNRLKDFFSNVSLSGQRMMTTMTGPSFPQ
jgi:hypothetical protein